MHQLYTTSLLALLLLSYSSVSAQDDRATHQAKYQMSTWHTDAPIKVDGDLNEPGWQKASKSSDFAMKWPRDGGPAPYQTIVQSMYSDQFLYIGITAIDSTPNHVIQSLKRDVGYWDSDGVAVVLDPANTAVNGYFFGISAIGVQTEALLTQGSDDMDRNWDNTWWVETKQYDTYWTAEFAIPLRILRYKTGQKQWGVNIIRNDLGNGIYSTWSNVPFQFDGLDLGFTGVLNWEESPKSVKGNYNIVPYLSAGTTRDYEANEDWKPQAAAGLDAKIGIGSGLNLDVTVNPDFSQIEIDEQVVNLTRFDVQLPEKRTFFLENADIFGNYGIPPIRPFFSRRIGLSLDGVPSTIYGGLRLTGNLNQNTRIGVLTMQTEGEEKNATQNYSAVSVNRRLFGRTNVAGYFLNREQFNQSEHQRDAFSRNAGIDANFTSTDGKWQGWFTHHRSFQPGVTKENWWGNSGVGYSNRKFNTFVDFLHMGENYIADLGFERRIENYDFLRDTVIRLGYNFIFSNSDYRIFPKNKEGIVNFVEISAELFQVINPDRTLNESSNNISAEINFKNTSSISAFISPNYANVPVSFKFDGEDNETCPPLPAAAYSYFNGGLGWSSDYRKRFFFSVQGSGGQFYNGHIYTGTVEATWRYRTLLNLRFAASYNRLAFPQPYCSVDFLNITPRIEVFFSKKMWWTTFIQYNNQADNFNINSRLQWRFRPMSDLFVVYTDNYGVEVPGIKNRALVAKVNYWF
jgi:hypothetical protein